MPPFCRSPQHQHSPLPLRLGPTPSAAETSTPKPLPRRAHSLCPTSRQYTCPTSTCRDAHTPRQTGLAEPSLHLSAHMQAHTLIPFLRRPLSLSGPAPPPPTSPDGIPGPPQQAGAHTSAPSTLPFTNICSPTRAGSQQQPQAGNAPRAPGRPSSTLGAQRQRTRQQRACSSEGRPGRGREARPELPGSHWTLSPAASRDRTAPQVAHYTCTHTYLHPEDTRTARTHQNFTLPQTHLCTQPQMGCTQRPTEPRRKGPPPTRRCQRAWGHCTDTGQHTHGNALAPMHRGPPDTHARVALYTPRPPRARLQGPGRPHAPQHTCPKHVPTHGEPVPAPLPPYT